MLDPRIYRMGLIVVALAVIVIAFSLQGQPGGVTTTLPPEAFNGQSAYAEMSSLAARYPDRRPGSSGDQALAGYVAASLKASGFSVSLRSFEGRTAIGRRTLSTVIGTRQGLHPGSIVIVSHRDSLESPAVADLSGTAVMLELARVLAGETQHRAIMLVSTSGSAGAAGAAEVARTVPGPVDAVLALGDLAGLQVGQPVVVPWSGGRRLASPMLRNTVSAALQDQSQLGGGGIGLASQFAHLAFPFSPGEQAPFADRGEPAVLLSLQGDRAPSGREPLASSARITELGRAVLQTVNALDEGPQISAPSSYLLLGGKLLPDWTVRLLVLALILPVAMITVDGAARARRRRHRLTPWLVWVIAGALPFLLALALGRLAGLTDALAAPPGAVAGGGVAVSAGGVAVAVVEVLIIAGLLLGRRRIMQTVWPRPELAEPGGGGALAGVLIVMTLLALAVWAVNPFAAALLLPALHLWPWALDPERPLSRPLSAALLALGLLGPAAVVLLYALELSLSPAGLAWSALLLFAGAGGTVVVALQWSVAMGCLASAVSILARRPDRPQRRAAAVTVRGPVSYAGPGSLGGTGSALRR